MEYRDSVFREEKLGTGEQCKIVKIDAGQRFSGALTSDGELFVWGKNDFSQLGLGEEGAGDLWSSQRYPRLVRSLPMEGHRYYEELHQLLP